MTQKEGKMKNHTLFFLLLFMGLTMMTSNAANPGDYKTKASGNWNQVAIWQYYNGSSWVNATVSPTYTDGQIDVLSGYSVTVTANLTIDQTDIHGGLTINSGVTLTVNDGSSTDLSIYNPVTVNGTVVNHGTISGTAAEFIFNSGSLYQHSKDGGALPDATWNSGSTCEITGVTSSSSISNVDQSFYHFKWNCSAQTAETNCAGNLVTIRGNFIMANTGVNGKLKLGESADYTLTISGSWEQSGGTLNMGGGSSWAYINLMGNFSMSGGRITEGNTSGYTSRISFSKTGIQSYTRTGGTFENNIDFEIVSGSTLDMGESVVDGSLGLFSVNSGATLKTSHLNGISGSGASGNIQTASRYYSLAANYQYCRSGSQATGNGIPSPLNGKLFIGSTLGATNLTLTNGAIVINGSLVLCSSTAANSSIVSGTVSYGATAWLEYQGASAQTASIKEWPAVSPPLNVTVNNSYGVNLDNDRTVSNTLALSAGTFSIGAHTLTLNGTLVQSSGVLEGGNNSNLVIGGISVTALDLPDVTVKNLVLERASGIRLTGNVVINGTMTMTNGPVTLMPGKTMSYGPEGTLKYNGTANQITGQGEFPVGNPPPSLEVDKPVGTTLSLGFSRTISKNLTLVSGDFSVGSNTLSLTGFPIAGEPSNMKTTNLSGLIFGGFQPGFFIPPGISQLGTLTISNLSGITLESDITVQSGTMVMQPFIMGINVIKGSGSFHLMADAKLTIGHPSGVSGNIQATGPIILDSNADYEFSGNSDQVTNFLPTTTPNTIRNLIIGNVEPNNVTLNSDITVTGELNILPGAKLTIDSPFTLSAESNVIVH